MSKPAIAIGAGIGTLLGGALFNIVDLGPGALGSGIGAALGVFLVALVSHSRAHNGAARTNPARRRDS
jgi:hypothetical protein